MKLEQAVRFSLEHMQELALFFDENGRIRYNNSSAAESLEYGDEMQGISIVDILPEAFSLQNGVLKNHLGYGDDLVELNAYRANRTCCPLVARLLRCEEGEGYVCLAYDATEKVHNKKLIERTKIEAEDALRVKSEFIANVTHELRTPVNGILGNSRELAEMEDSPEKKKLLALIERGCADMNAIINNILDFSKLEAGKFTLEKREFDFYEMIDYVKSNHKNKITEKGLDFLVTIAPDIPRHLIGDELRIVQVLNNLLSNACKFTSVGRIVVEAVKTAQVDNRMELFFLVIDTGIGIDKAGQDKLFKSFSQVDASISRRFGGTGLGLNISKQLVELMEGDIHVDSEPGKGSMFSFHIWVEIPEEELNTQKETAETPPVVSAGFSSMLQTQEQEAVWTYGTDENFEEIRRRNSKLILCVEMDNWEKAETFADAIKKLTEGAPQEVKSAALRLKMAVQKGDYDKTTAALEKLKAAMEDGQR